ncbi:MAG: transglycosylase SLT domain-containing protein [Rhodobacteraceae bacterium]|nr:transglycosylase SLT domain-containing protein [Paracoccaceae bacterium]
MPKKNKELCCQKSVVRRLCPEGWGLTAAIVCLAVLFGVAPRGSAQASVKQVAALCDAAAQRAARDSGVPLDVLRTITRTETGRGGKQGLQPWPWTVNMEGAGKWFETEDEARAYVFSHFKRGARSFDVGCFQINFKWHGAEFESIDQMFDPLANAQYAARFLKKLYAEMGDWSKAAGAYHSRTPTYATRYSARFDRIRADLAPATTVAALPGRTRRRSSDGALPLASLHTPSPLIAQGSVSMGSLVPMARSVASPLALIMIE